MFIENEINLYMLINILIICFGFVRYSMFYWFGYKDQEEVL